MPRLGQSFKVRLYTSEMSQGHKSKPYWLGQLVLHARFSEHRRIPTATVNGTPAYIVLDVRVQPGRSAVAQSLVSYGASCGVTVTIKVYP